MSRRRILIASTMVGFLAIGLARIEVGSARPVAHAGPTSSVEGRSTLARLVWHLWCDKTTEAGEDEVYMLVAWKTTDGRSWSGRLPNETGHWDLNDNGPKRGIEDVPLAAIPLSPGQSATVVVSVMEEDGGSPNGYAASAAGLLGLIPTPGTRAAGAAVGALSRLFQIKDSDDYIGSFNVLISNDGGTFTVQGFPMEKVIEDVPAERTGGGPGTHGFRMNGDGSNYYGWGKVIP